jgi:putative ATPase
MKELGYGKEYKYNPDYVDGQVVQDYLPDQLEGRTFFGDADLGDKIDTELGREDEAMSVECEGEREHEILLGPDGD